MYISVKTKFNLSIFFASLWVIFSIWFSQNWFYDLSEVFPKWFSIYIIATLAIIPGFISLFFLSAQFLDKRPKIKENLKYPPISILISAYNEEAHILSTIDSILNQEYDSTKEIIVVDDGSTDSTYEKLIWFSKNKFPLILIKNEPNIGKALSLNKAIEKTSNEILITLDADSILHKNALKNLVARYLSDPIDTAAVAGTMLVKNSRDNFCTKLQECDYFLGISLTKRVQSLFQATSVAQGAFSLYVKSAVEKWVGGKKTIGEDIVLTWELIRSGYRIGHAENAYCFTVVPNTFSQLIKQRKRWASGFIESLQYNYPIMIKRNYFILTILFNILFVFIDFSYIFIFLPGLIASLFGYFLIAGPLTLIVVGMGTVINSLIFKKHKKPFNIESLELRKNKLGYVVYTICYSFIIQFASILGYIDAIFHRNLRWGTK